MEREDLIRASQTAQVRMLAEEFLSDGEVHSRKDIVDYVVAQGRTMGLDTFRSGHLAGGVREATINLECETVGRAMFRATVCNPAVRESRRLEEKSVNERAAEVCRNAWEQISQIAREIDFVNADEEQVAQLMKLKAGVQKLKNIQREFEESN